MAVDLQPNKDQVDLANRKAVAYMLVVAIVLLGIMSTMYFTSNRTNRADNLAQIKAVVDENKELKAENKELRAEILRVVIQSAQEKEEVKKNTDSAIRKAVNTIIK